MKCDKCGKDMNETRWKFECKDCKRLYDKGFKEWFDAQKNQNSSNI